MLIQLSRTQVINKDAILTVRFRPYPPTMMGEKRVQTEYGSLIFHCFDGKNYALKYLTYDDAELAVEYLLSPRKEEKYMDLWDYTDLDGYLDEVCEITGKTRAQIPYDKDFEF